MMLGAALLMLAATSCRDESDFLAQYSTDDALVFTDAEKSYAAQFKLFWNAMNQNYGLWDFEKEQGLDWDDVYGKFLPRFEELDKRDKTTNPVTDEEYQKLLNELVAPLHDGHFYAEFLNPHTGKRLLAYPNMLRLKQREDYSVSSNFTLPIAAYLNAGWITEQRSASTYPLELAYMFKNTYDIEENKIISAYYGLGFVVAQIGFLEKLKEFTPLTDEQEILLENLVSLYNEWVAGAQYVKSANDWVALYNTVAAKYGQLDIPGLYYLGNMFNEINIDIQYALFNGNIPYLYISAFKLSPYLQPDYIAEFFGSLPEGHPLFSLIESVRNTWKEWFLKVQELKAEGKLKGVIIDLRSNSGGLSNDFQYVLGSLMGQGGTTQVGYQRIKNGVGRYDFTPIMTDLRPNLDYEKIFGNTDEKSTFKQQAITEPIVVLTNCMSGSMAEITAMSAKNISNCHVVGKRTFGALCTLTGNPNFSKVYAGHIGVKGVTPVYCYIPSAITLQMDQKTILDGYGITPDVEVDYDVNLFNTTGRDSQLEHALQLIQ